MAPNTKPSKPSKKGGAAGKDGAKAGKSKPQHWTSKRPVGGKGIFVTCVRGKESRCVSEMYDLLEEVADRLYPPERIVSMQAAREAQRAEREAAGQPAQDEGENDVDGAGDREMTPAPELEPEPSPAEDDLDDEMERELAALRAGSGRKQAPSKGGKEAKGKQKDRPRFQSIQTDTECLCFFATAWPYDPVELTEAIVSEVAETGVSRTRFTQRLSPISFSCHALSVDQIEQQSALHIEKCFAEWAAANNTTSLTYQIEPTLRSHNAPLSRSMLLPLLGSTVSRLSSAPTISSPVPSRPLLSSKADLKQPDLVILPTVLKSCFGLSVVEGALWRGKKFNLEMIAKEVRERRLREEEEEKAGMKKEGEKQEEQKKGEVVEAEAVKPASAEKKLAEEGVAA